MPDFAVVTAFKATDKVSPAFRRMGAASKTFENQAVGSFRRISNVANKTRSAIMSALPYVGIATLGIYANKAINLASDLTEVQNVVDTTFKESSKQIDKWSANALDKFGLSELQAKNFTGTLGSMAKSSGITGTALVDMTTKLVGLAGDYASFRNLQPAEAFEKIKSVVTGETEPMRQLGINMTVANLQAFALTQGITKKWKAMSQAEQVMLRYNYIMKASKDAQGDFAKTLDTSYANQKRVLGVQFDQFLANIAKNILPSLTEVFKSLNTAIRNMPVETFAKALQAIAKIIPIVVAGFIAYKLAIWSTIIAQQIMIAVDWIKYLWMMREFINAVTIKQWLWNAAMSANPLAIVIIAVAALVYHIRDLIKNWDTFGKSMSFSLGPIGMVISAFKTIYDQWDAIKKAFTTEGMIAGLKKLGAAILDAFNPFSGLLEKLESLKAGKAPNQSNAEMQAGNTTVNINNRNVETKASITPRQGAKINYAVMGAQ